MNKELILGQIPDNFSLDKHIAISPNCFIGKEHIYPNFENLDYISTIESKNQLKEYDNLSTEEALYWVNIIAKKYNPTEFDKHSFHFWKTIYFPWLGAFIPWIYRKKLLIDKLIEQYGGEELLVNLISKELVFEVDNEINFIIDGFWNQTINNWMFSRLLEKKLPKKWTAKVKHMEFISDSITISRFSRKPTFKTKIAALINKTFFRNIGVYNFNPFDQVFFHILFAIKPKLTKGVKPEFVYEKKINWDINLLEVIDFLIPNTLKDIDSNSNRRAYSLGKFVNYSNRLYYDTKLKIEAAQASENGELIISTQHGGHNYGSALTLEYGKEIEYKTDLFISWGWNIRNNKNIRMLGLPSPLLSKFLNKHTYSKNEIILVGTDMTGFQRRFDSGPTEVDYIDYRRNKISFINGISKRILEQGFNYRPYPEKQTSFLDSKYILKHFSQINIHKGNLHMDMQNCKLLILDHPGTTWNIAMAMNTPLVLFWNRNHFPFNKEADEFLDRFKQLNIYFEKPEEAAIKVNELNKKYTDLSLWWNQKEIQNLRMEWMNVYARADKNWFWIWTKTLWNLK